MRLVGTTGDDQHRRGLRELGDLRKDRASSPAGHQHVGDDEVELQGLQRLDGLRTGPSGDNRAVERLETLGDELHDLGLIVGEQHTGAARSGHAGRAVRKPPDRTEVPGQAVGELVLGNGNGRSKKEAEQLAAQAALQLLADYLADYPHAAD